MLFEDCTHLSDYVLTSQNFFQSKYSLVENNCHNLHFLVVVVICESSFNLTETILLTPFLSSLKTPVLCQGSCWRHSRPLPLPRLPAHFATVANLSCTCLLPAQPIRSLYLITSASCTPLRPTVLSIYVQYWTCIHLFHFHFHY